MKFKKVTLIAMGLSVLLSSLTGCSSNKASDQRVTAAENSKASTDGKTIRFLNVSPSEARDSYYQETFQRFQEETGITVEYESVPWDDAVSKLMVMGAADELPDIITMDTIWLGQFVASDWLVPLDSYLADVEDQFTDTVRTIWWDSQRESYGSAYTVPDGVMVKGIYVRKDWAEAAGLKLDPEAGWDYDEYFQTIAALTDVSQKHYGVAYRGARGGFHPILFYLESFTGGQLYDEEGNILINSEECLEAFEKWTSVYKDGYAPQDSINWGFSEMMDSFTGGLTGTFLNDSECVANCQADMAPDSWMVMPIPRSTKDGKIYNQLNAPYSYAMTTDSKNPDLAWELLLFLSDSENNADYCSRFGVMPIKKEAEANDFFTETGVYSTFVKQLNNPDLVYPCNFGPFGVSDLEQGFLHEEIQKYLLNQQSAEDALGNITGELEKRMKNYLAENPGKSVETPKLLSDK